MAADANPARLTVADVAGALERHQPRTVANWEEAAGYRTSEVCRGCDLAWPCDAIMLAGEVAALRADNAAAANAEGLLHDLLAMLSWEIPIPVPLARTYVARIEAALDQFDRQVDPARKEVS